MLSQVSKSRLSLMESGNSSAELALAGSTHHDSVDMSALMEPAEAPLVASRST